VPNDLTIRGAIFILNPDDSSCERCQKEGENMLAFDFGYIANRIRQLIQKYDITESRSSSINLHIKLMSKQIRGSSTYLQITRLYSYRCVNLSAIEPTRQDQAWKAIGKWCRVAAIPINQRNKYTWINTRNNFWDIQSYPCRGILCRLCTYNNNWSSRWVGSIISTKLSCVSITLPLLCAIYWSCQRALRIFVWVTKVSHLAFFKRLVT